MKQAKLVVIDDHGSDAEWRIGYVNDEPAVGDAAGRWYTVPQEAIVPQPSQQLVWLCQQGEWSCVHQMHWNSAYTPATNPDAWLLSGPVLLVK